MITIKSPAEIKEEIHQALEKKNREAWDKAEELLKEEQGLKTEFYHISIRWA